MPRPQVHLPPSVFPLPQDTDRPLRWRLHQGLKAAILNGQFPPGVRLPSTRALASSFGMSRSTVVEAFDQLIAEGFIESRAGSGSYVSHQLDGLRAQRRAERRDVPPDPPVGHAQPAEPVRPMAFTPCEPDVEHFPHQLLARYLAKRARSQQAQGDSPGPAGLPRLREALATHLTLARGVRASPDRIIIVSGARQALHLAANVLLRPGDRVWFEDPGYPAARAAFAWRGARVQPVPVDRHGIDVEAGQRGAPDGRAAYVTPSHQFPTGAVMGLGRRVSLLEWAAEHDAWIFEDDYDSEFCYDNRPLPALQGLDEHQSVIYIGTLNKVAYPGLRVGYLVVPARVVDAFTEGAAAMSLSPSAVLQEAIADFVADGHLARHVNRMRGTYKERQRIMVDELRRGIPDQLSVEPSPIGMHILASLRGVQAERVELACRTRGLDVRALSRYAVEAIPDNAIIIGYTHLQSDRIRSAVRDLAGVVSRVRHEQRSTVARTAWSARR